MKVIAIQSSPNKDGMTHAAAQAALRGAQKAGAETDLLDLNDLRILPCQACGQGWGRCEEKGKCDQKDDFSYLRQVVNSADAIIFASPVYFGDLSESAKLFLDRWRRCEVYDREHSPLKGKPVMGIAVAGGTGTGAINTLASLEKYFQWLQFNIWDLVPVTTVNKMWKLKAIETAARELVDAAEAAEPPKKKQRRSND